MKKCLTALAVLVLFAAGPAPAAAQETAAEVSGFVRDATGGVLPGVTVTVRMPAIGFDRSTVTNDNGFYVVPSLPVGEAEISAELDGFQREHVSGLALAVKARLRLDLTLRVGRIDETVNV